MLLTYTALKEAHFRNIGKAGQFADTNLLADFQFNLGTRYQMVMASLSSYINQDTLTALTVASQQYYYYPVGTVGIDSATITIGSVKYTLTPIYDQHTWNTINAMALQPSAIPQFIFARKNDFGIWPIPTDVYTITFQRFFRDRNLLVDDYEVGTCIVTNDDATVTGTGTTFTAAMVGRWFSVSQTSTPGQGYWYRVASVTDTTHLELDTLWAAASASTVTYTIGEAPEIPAEGHTILVDGTTADFYSGIRNSATNAIRFDNKFWTGTFTNASRELDDKNITAGLIGMIRRYEDRDRDIIVYRQPSIISPQNKIFSQTIS